MQPQLHLLGLHVKSFALMVALAYAAALVLLGRRAKELRVPDRWVLEGVLIAMVTGLAGARAWSIAQNAGDFGSGWAHAILNGGGLVWYGGVAGGAVGVAGWAVWRRVPLLLCCDAAGLVLPVVQAIGRVGCQLAGDGDYGKPSHLPWAMAYPHGTVPTPPGVRVHPTPLYEIAALTVLAVWLWRRRDELRPGMAFALYLAGMGTERFLVEFVRRNSDVVAGLTLAQLTSIGCVAVGACWIALCVRGRAAFVRPPLAYAARPLGEHGTPARQRT